MRVVLSRILIALAGGMAASGCALQDEAIIDLTAVGGGDGTTVATARILPTTMPAGTDGGINDYMVAAPGFWQFDYSPTLKQIDNGAAVGFGNLIYNSTTDIWQLTVDGTDYTYLGTGTSETCPVGCVTLTRFGTVTADYGTFAFAKYVSGTDVSFAAMYYGMLGTDVQTTGTGTFNGEFKGAVYQETLDAATATITETHVFDASATVKVVADFGADSVTLSTPTAGSLIDSAGVAPSGNFTLSGTAVIGVTDNTYSGTSNATVTLTEYVLVPDPIDPISNPPTVGTITVPDTYTGTIAGGFYGPGGIETAGAVEAGNGGTNTLAGAYWAERDVNFGF